MGQIRAGEYMLVNLEPGTYTFDLLHLDLVNMRSTHKLSIDQNTRVIKIEPTTTSNKLAETNKLPQDFDKFKQCD